MSQKIIDVPIMTGKINGQDFTVYRKHIGNQKTFYMRIKGISLDKIEAGLTNFFESNATVLYIQELKVYLIANIPDLIIDNDPDTNKPFCIIINDKKINIRSIVIHDGKFGKLNLNSNAPNSNAPNSNVPKSKALPKRVLSLNRQPEESTNAYRASNRASNRLSSRSAENEQNIKTPRASHSSINAPRNNGTRRNSMFTRFRKGAYQTYKRRNPKTTNAYYELKLIYFLNELSQKISELNINQWEIIYNLNTLIYYATKLISTINKIRPKTLYKYELIKSLFDEVSGKIDQEKKKLDDIHSGALTSEIPDQIHNETERTQKSIRLRWDDFESKMRYFKEKHQIFQPKRETNVNAINKDIYSKDYIHYRPKLINPNEMRSFQSYLDQLFDRNVERGMGHAVDMLAFGSF